MPLDGTEPGLGKGRVMQAQAAKQFSFRLPVGLVDRVEQCMDHLHATGLEVTRADVVRMLLKHALDATHCKVERLLGGGGRGSKERARKRRP
jgi:hypothetical protein